MRRFLGAIPAGCLLIAALAAPSVALGATTQTVDCRSGADLQAAIDAAPSGATLVIRGTCVGNFIIDKDLTLEGRGHHPRLTAHGSGTVLTIPAANRATGATVRICHLEISGGNPDGIENWGRVTLERSTVRGNAGFGITNNGDFGGTTVDLLHSIVRGNTGGGIWSLLGHIALDHSTVSGNSGVGAVGVDGLFELSHSIVRGNGSGILASGQAVFALDQSTVRDNAGRGVTISNGSVDLVDSTVSQNKGGGIYEGVLGYLTMLRSRVIGNTADFGAGIYIASHDAGRGVTITDSKIKGNRATTSGGGVYAEGSPGGDTFNSVVITHNAAGVSGGGMYIAGGVLGLTDVTFRHNTPDDCIGC